MCTRDAVTAAALGTFTNFSDISVSFNISGAGVSCCSRIVQGEIVWFMVSEVSYINNFEVWLTDMFKFISILHTGGMLKCFEHCP